jgi:hypothetical protein
MQIGSMEEVGHDGLHPGSGSVYHKKIILTELDTFIAYLLPFRKIYTIGADIDGDGSLEFTIDSPKTIEDGNAEFIAWDEVSPINLHATGFRVVWNSGTVTAKVTVKSDN